MHISKEILYPYFLNCTEFTNGDKYWNSIFENLSYGICPYGIYINNNYLCCNHKIHKFRYSLTNKNSKTLYNDIYKILSDFGLMSKKDKLSIYNDSTKDYSNINWGLIKKKSIKATLIEKYVIEKQKEYNLSHQQANTLLKTINIGLLLKTILPKHITYNDNRITDITCIDFDNNYYTFKINIYNYSSNFIVI